MRKLILIFCAIFFVCLGNSEAIELISGRDIYVVYSGETVKMGWDTSQGANYYDLKAWHYEQEMPVQSNQWVNIQATQISIPVPRSGHFIWQVRACNNEGCSDWSESINSSVTNNKPWWVYAHVAPPSGGGVD